MLDADYHHTHRLCTRHLKTRNQTLSGRYYSMKTTSNLKKLLRHQQLDAVRTLHNCMLITNHVQITNKTNGVPRCCKTTGDL